MDKREPPVVLVRTWVELLRTSDVPEVKARASEMLLNAFGDMASAAEFMKKNNIQ